MKQMIAVALAATLALTSLPSPVLANDRDEQIGKILFGLAALAVLGAAIENRNDNDRPRVSVQTATPPRHSGGLGIPPRARVLPAQCFRRIETQSGQSRFFGKRCLRNNYRYADRLPVRCEIGIRTNHGIRVGYRPRCLRDAGFSMARN